MFSLSNEVQLDVLKCLNFNQLFSVKQTNFYFCKLISKYEGGLARKKFHELSIINEIPNLNLNNIIEPQFGDFEFILNDQLKEKWQEAIDKSKPLFLSNFESVRKLVSIKKTFTYLEDKQAPYLIRLPNIPKNIEGMIIIRCWLEQLFNCAFEHACFYKSVFNPEMIKILFDNDKTIPAQFNIQKLFLFPSNKTFENVLKFSLNHLSISEYLSINLDDVDITEKY
uniref:F-box domain-containing protein n=1 Tax=Meloidogyne incognita TaxID=6306 RepID=A0A914MKG5_MELIC